jgi:hopanoid biosynthesis associated radical SAM protein HpnH
MGVPIRQQMRVAGYIARQKLSGRSRFPLVLMLEPLFDCNLRCNGCGKIAYPEEVMNRRLGVEDCLSIAEECGAPVVSIAGGEPLLHEGMPAIVEGILARKKYVYLCTNALLLKKRIGDYVPSPRFTFSIHLDGDRRRHDSSAGRPGVFDRAVEAIRIARGKGFRVTINCTLYEGVTAKEASVFFDFVTSLGVEGITVAPGFHYQRVPHRDLFLKRKASKELFREIFTFARGRRWRFNHTNLYLDFLAGNQDYRCTPWGSPTRNIFGWQRPCYLLVDEGYAATFQSLMEETDWDSYGTSRNPKCAQCMLHSGFEPTAVNDLLAHPFKAFRLFLSGPRTEGPMVFESTRGVAEPIEQAPGEQ